MCVAAVRRHAPQAPDALLGGAGGIAVAQAVLGKPNRSASSHAQLRCPPWGNLLEHLDGIRVRRDLNSDDDNGGDDDGDGQDKRQLGCGYT